MPPDSDPPTMTSIPAETRENIKCLRLLRRWDQMTLAQRAGISPTAVSQIETGRVAPTVEQVAGLARALGYSARFLLDGPFSDTTKPWLRAYADASRREADARTAATSVAAEYIKRLKLSPFPNLIPPFDGDPEDIEAIEDAATELRLLAGIGPDEVIGNAIRAAERLGCVLLPLESEMGRHLGMSLRAGAFPMICVAKSGVPGDRQRFTVAHELGHLTLHGQTPPPRDANEASRLEKQANRFAVAFLGPGDALLETLHDVGGRVTLTTLAEIKSIWGIAIKSLVGRFHSLGEIDADHARSLYKQISARQWSKHEPVDVPTESAQWLAKALIRKADADDLANAAALLAVGIGGNIQDLLGFANWTTYEQPAPVISMRTRRVI